MRQHLLVFALLASTIPACAAAEIFTVTTVLDQVVADGQCSIREAFDAALAGSVNPDCPTTPGDDTLVLDAAGTYALTSPLTVPGGESIALRGDGDQPRTAYWLDGGNARQVLVVQPGASVQVEHLTIYRGVTAGYGGGIFAEDADLVLRDVTLQTCVAERGAGLYWQGGSPARRLLVEDSAFVDGLATAGNFLPGRGAGAYVAALAGNQVRLAGVRFYLNIATNDTGNNGLGGGLYLHVVDASVRVAGVEFTSNTSHAAGAGAYVYMAGSASPSVEIVDATLQDNTGSSSTIGSWLQKGSLRIGRTQLVDNSGGNQARFDLEADAALVLDSLLVANSPGYGLAVELLDDSTFLGGHLTVTANAGKGIDIHDFSSSTPRLESSILWNNGPSGGNDIDSPYDFPTPTFDHMLIGELGHPNPSFVDPAGGVYDVQQFSPAEDAGVATFATVGKWDARHGRRVVGSAPDLGAFERTSLFAWDGEEGDLFAWSLRVPASP